MLLDEILENYELGNYKRKEKKFKKDIIDFLVLEYKFDYEIAKLMYDHCYELCFDVGSNTLNFEEYENGIGHFEEQLIAEIKLTKLFIKILTEVKNGNNNE